MNEVIDVSKILTNHVIDINYRLLYKPIESTKIIFIKNYINLEYYLPLECQLWYIEYFDDTKFIL